MFSIYSTSSHAYSSNIYENPLHFYKLASIFSFKRRYVSYQGRFYDFSYMIIRKQHCTNVQYIHIYGLYTDYKLFGKLCVRQSLQYERFDKKAVYWKKRPTTFVDFKEKS
jgi:hypothetical protein